MLNFFYRNMNANNNGEDLYKTIIKTLNFILIYASSITLFTIILFIAFSFRIGDFTLFLKSLPFFIVPLVLLYIIFRYLKKRLKEIRPIKLNTNHYKESIELDKVPQDINNIVEKIIYKLGWKIENKASSEYIIAKVKPHVFSLFGEKVKIEILGNEIKVESFLKVPQLQLIDLGKNQRNVVYFLNEVKKELGLEPDENTD